MEKIKRLKLSPILAGKAIYENLEGTKIMAVSIGSDIEIRKADGASALYIESSSAKSVRYNKIEEKDLELVTLQNELAGIVGQFDSSVHKLMAKYGYEWVNPEEATAAAPISTMESVNEAGTDNPTGTWIGDFFVSSVININKFVDAAANQYDFGDEQKLENSFRAKVKEMIKELVGGMYEPENDSDEAITDCVTSVLADMSDELTEFEDYRVG